MKLWVLLAGLSGIAVEDWKKREISLLVVNGFTGVGLLAAGASCLIRQNGAVLWQAICGILPGVFLLCLSRIAKGAIGEGDGWLLIMIGVYLGAVKAWVLLWLSSLLIMLVGCIVVICKRGTGKTRIPWAPFALVAYVVLWTGGALG